MTNTNLLCITPDYNDGTGATYIGAAWLRFLIDEEAKKVNLPFLDLYKEQATKTNFETEMQRQDPLLVHLFGHGNYNLITCQNGQILLTGCTNDQILAERVVYVLSCKCGRDLGLSAVRKGAFSFLGYKENFTFDTLNVPYPPGDPLTDKVAEAFFRSHAAAIISYIHGNSVRKSYADSQHVFNYWIPIIEDIDPLYAADLVWDRDHQVLNIGEIEPPILPGKIKIAPLLLFAGLLLIPLLRKRSRKI